MFSHIQDSDLRTQAAALGNTAMQKEANLQCMCADALNIDWSDVQVRQLQSIGFGVSRDILAEVDTANKFYRHGLLLKQVVNFYNNSATEIIPCQKPMLLQVRPTAKSAGACCLLWSAHAVKPQAATEMASTECCSRFSLGIHSLRFCHELSDLFGQHLQSSSPSDFSCPAGRCFLRSECSTWN